jgi:hypothetical protein
VYVALKQIIQAFPASGFPSRGESFSLEGFLEDGCDRLIIFDDQDMVERLEERYSRH